MKEKNNSLFL